MSGGEPRDCNRCERAVPVQMVVSPSTGVQHTQPVICAKIIESNSICDYCSTSKEDCNECPCFFDAPQFRGRKLQAVA